MKAVCVLSMSLIVVLSGCPGAPAGGEDGGVDSPTLALDAPTDVDGNTGDGGEPDTGAGSDAGDDSGSLSDSGLPFDSGSLPDTGAPSPDAGPGGCVSNADCTVVGTYCAKEDGDCDGVGRCMPRPIICDGRADPVCGCDGNDYSSPCDAAGDGANVGSFGTCATSTCAMRPPLGCCFDGGDCGRGGRCMNAVCVADGAGTCVGPLEGRSDCWDDSDCAGGTCTGARICPCGARCLLPDAPGRCTTDA